jgi:hypothetical protein
VVLIAGLMQDAATVAPLAEALRAADLDDTEWVPADYGSGDIRLASDNRRLRQCSDRYFNGVGRTVGLRGGEARRVPF